jgi:hypothetical protein
MEKVLPAKNGLPTAFREGRYIHSAYDPEKEALRFSRSSGQFPKGSVVLLLGEALGYLSRRLARDNPGIRLLPVYCSAYFYDNRIQSAGEDAFSSWRPGTPENFSAFLGRNIGEADFPSLHVLEWEPAARAFPFLLKQLREDVSRFGRQVNGSLLTMAVFGKKWITNSLRNYLALDEAATFIKISGPVCVAASGPGLAAALPFLKGKRRAFTLFALPSAAAFLQRHSVEADGIIMTDPGFYTGLHFSALLRREQADKGGSLLCMPLSAYSGFHGKTLPVCLFHQGTQPEKALLAGISPAPVRVPSNGTAAGTAVQMALSFGPGPVILLGLDMAAKGIEEHVRPNAFDEYYTVRGCRFEPEEGGRAGRIFAMYQERLAGAWRTSPALKTYAGWFSSLAGVWKDRVFRISDSPVDTGCLSSYAEAEKLLGQGADFVCEKLRMPSLNGRKEKAAAFIKTIEESARFADSLPPEAAGLLMMIDTAGVLEIRKKTPCAVEKVRRTIEEFSSSLYSLLKAYK